MTPSLHQIGEALYGPRWQSELARALDVSDRTVRRWAAGADMPEGAWEDIRQLCAERSAALHHCLRNMRATFSMPRLPK